MTTVITSRVKPFPATLREQVSEENPLEVDVFYSMRSPYSYLSLFRLAYLHSCYNVNVNIKVIFPVAARTAKPGQKSAIGGRWYFWSYTINDSKRTARYEGIPFRMFNPDPILADTWPPWSGTQITAPMDKQPYITWLVRLGNAAQLEGKTLEYCLAVSPYIFGAQCPIGEWPFHVEAAVQQRRRFELQRRPSRTSTRTPTSTTRSGSKTRSSFRRPDRAVCRPCRSTVSRSSDRIDSTSSSGVYARTV